MKNMPKNLLDELIEAERAFWYSGADNIDRIKAAAFKIQEETELCFTAPWDIVNQIIRPSGFCPGADNETIYSVLRVLGWVVE